MRVVSYSFYRHPASAYESERAGEGRGRFFVNYLRAIVRGHWAVYPDWRMEIRHDDRVREYPYFRILERMRDSGLLKLFPMGPAATLCGSMLWRLLPIWSRDVDYVICRDVDSLSTPRERIAVERWIKSGKAVHSICDSVSHVPGALMGGMIGVRTYWFRQQFPAIESLLSHCDRLGIDLNRHGADQQLLNAVVLPLAEREGEVWADTTEILPPKGDGIDSLTNHIGGAYHVDPCVKWFSENPGACPQLALIDLCEREGS